MPTIRNCITKFTIIAKGLGYPDLKAGFLMTSKMAKLISKEVTDNDNSLDIKYIPKYWTVDASFDLAKSIHILNEKKVENICVIFLFELLI